MLPLGGLWQFTNDLFSVSSSESYIDSDLTNKWTGQGYQFNLKHNPLTFRQKFSIDV